MSAYHMRKSCAACRRTLPRAALNRCPLCLEPIHRARGPVVPTCGTCKEPLPLAHAGQCPVCAVANRHGPAPLAAGG